MLENNIIGSVIKEGTVIAIFNNAISSKEKHDKYFSVKWFDDNIEAENKWNELTMRIKEHFKTETIMKKYSAVVRKELIIGGRINL